MMKEAIEFYLRSSIVYNNSDFTPQGAKYRGIDWEVLKEAMYKCRVFQLVEHGGFSYSDLGIHPVNEHGAYPRSLIIEHLYIKGVYYDAQRDRKA